MALVRERAKRVKYGGKMKKLLYVLLIVCALTLCLGSCHRDNDAIQVLFDCGADILTTDMTEEDLRQYLTVSYCKDIANTRNEFKETDKYTVRCDFTEGSCEIFVEYKGNTSSVKEFFVDKSKMTYEGDYIFYTYNSKDYLLRYNGNASILTLPEREEYAIFDKAFMNNTSLTGIKLGNSVTNIGNEAFFGCTSLKEIYFGTSVKAICRSAFSSQQSIEKVDAPSLESWCNIKFNVPNLFEDNYVAMEYFVYDSEYLTPQYSYVINSDDGKTYVGGTEVVFVDLSGSSIYSSLPIYASVSNPLSISKSLSINGEHVTDIVIPESVTAINNYAFMGADITSVKIHSGVKSIGNGAFTRCEKLEDVSIESVSCVNLKNVFPESCMNDYNGAKYLGNEENPYMILVSSGSCEGAIDIHEDTVVIGSRAFAANKKFTEITIPDSVKVIGAEAMRGLDPEVRIIVGSGVEEVAARVFICSVTNSPFRHIEFKNQNGWYYVIKGDVNVNFDPGTLMHNKAIYDFAWYRTPSEEG